MKKFSYLVPIFVISFGRSGTTLMMQLLGSSEKIAFDRVYPYENRLLTYFYRLVNLPFVKDRPDFQWDNDAVFKPNVKQMGNIPTGTELFSGNERLITDLCKRVWDGVSYEIKNKNPKAIYYAEKIPHDLITLSKYMYTKNLFLLRDPRDELVSIINFNKKRNILGFGWRKDDNVFSYAQRMIKARKNFLKHFYNISVDERRYKIRYEDLINNFENESKKISEWLGVELNPLIVKSNEDKHKIHMTSQNIKDSVQRWKRELNDNVKELFKNELGEELKMCGYEV